MKTRLVWALACIAAGFVAGCAQKNPALTAQPTAEELPVPERPSDGSTIVVGVEHSQAERSTRLVPDFKPPELTPEEKAALGEEAPRHKFLPYNWFRTFGTRIGTWLGGITTAASGLRGATVQVDPTPKKVAAVPGAGGVTTAVDPAESPTGRVLPGDKSVAGSGPESGIRVGTDPVAKKTGGRQP